MNEAAEGIRVLASVLTEQPLEGRLELMRQISVGDERAAAFWEEHAGDDAGASIALRVDWTRLFRGLSPATGPRPPYEYLYAPAADEMGALLGIKLTYEAAGLTLGDEARNRPDYLGFELEFAAYLLETGNGAGDFAIKHLAWVPQFCAEARRYAKTGFFAWYLDMVEACVREMYTQ